jgi:hypothetical protein
VRERQLSGEAGVLGLSAHRGKLCLWVEGCTGKVEIARRLTPSRGNPTPPHVEM